MFTRKYTHQIIDKGMVVKVVIVMAVVMVVVAAGIVNIAPAVAVAIPVHSAHLRCWMEMSLSSGTLSDASKAILSARRALHAVR